MSRPVGRGCRDYSVVKGRLSGLSRTLIRTITCGLLSPLMLDAGTFNPLYGAGVSDLPFAPSCRGRVLVFPVGFQPSVSLPAGASTPAYSVVNAGRLPDRRPARHISGGRFDLIAWGRFLAGSFVFPLARLGRARFPVQRARHSLSCY